MILGKEDPWHIVTEAVVAFADLTKIKSTTTISGSYFMIFGIIANDDKFNLKKLSNNNSRL